MHTASERANGRIAGGGAGTFGRRMDPVRPMPDEAASAPIRMQADPGFASRLRSAPVLSGYQYSMPYFKHAVHPLAG